MTVPHSPDVGKEAATTDPRLVMRDAAAVLSKRGLSICKIDGREKKPTYKNWSTRSLPPGAFTREDMIGILGGPLSAGRRVGHALVIIDLDSAEAVALADDYLPATGMVEGRKSKPKSHRYYLVPCSSIPSWGRSTAAQAAEAAEKQTGHPGPATRSFAHKDTSAEVVRLIGTGGQAVCPPSKHPSGEVREWDGGEPGEPAVVEFPALWAAVCKLAEACGAAIPNVEPRQTTTVTVAGDTPASMTYSRCGKYLAAMPPSVSGCLGHDALFAATCAAEYGFDQSPEDALRLIEEHFNPRCTPPWTRKDIERKIAESARVEHKQPRGYLRDAVSQNTTTADTYTVPADLFDPAPFFAAAAAERGAGQPAGDPAHPPLSPYDHTTPDVFEDTDIANGRRFAADSGANVRYVADWAQWAVYDGRRWAVDRSETLVERLAKETADRMARAAAERICDLARTIAGAKKSETGRLNQEMEKAQASLAHAKRTADMRSIRRMLQAARSEPNILVTKGGEVFDRRRDLLNCANGTVDLRTGALRPHRQEDYITKLCPTRFDADAPRPAYSAFLEKIFDGKPALVGYVRLLSGYVCTGEVTDQSLVIFNGMGSNGKNVLVDTWKSVLGEGEYAHTAPADLLVGDGDQQHPTEKTGLRGARLVVCSETAEDGILDEAKMKSLTGGDTVAARFMRGDYFQFEPTHKLVLLTNHRPRVKGTDHGVWRRLRLVPFGVKFWKDEDRVLDPHAEYPEHLRADPTLGDRLRTTEAEGVLADMVANAVEVYRLRGIVTAPAEVTQATAEYQTDQDTIGQFFTAKVRDDKDGKVKAVDLYSAFSQWWEAEGHAVSRMPGIRKFGQATKRRFDTFRSSGTMYKVRIITGAEGEAERADGQMGSDFAIDAHLRSRESLSNPNHLPICPSARSEASGAGDESEVDARARQVMSEWGGRP